MSTYARNIVGGVSALLFVVVMALLEIDIPDEVRDGLLTGALAYLFGRETVSAHERKSRTVTSGSSTTVLLALLALPLVACGGTPIPPPTLERAQVSCPFAVEVEWLGWPLELTGEAQADTSETAANICLRLPLWERCYSTDDKRVSTSVQ